MPWRLGMMLLLLLLMLLLLLLLLMLLLLLLPALLLVLLILRSAFVYQRRPTTMLSLSLHLPPHPVVLLGFVPYIHTPPHKHTPLYAIPTDCCYSSQTPLFCSVQRAENADNNSIAQAKTEQQQQQQQQHFGGRTGDLISIHHTPPYTMPTATSVGQGPTCRSP